MKISDTIKIIKPEYVYLKLTPNNSIRNQSSYKIAKTISSLYKNVFQSIKKEEVRLIKLFGKSFLVGIRYSLKASEKIGYYIYIEKKKAEFYFIIPKQHLSLIKEKMSDVWDNITIKIVEEIPKFNKSAIKRQLVYEREDALSLSVDRRDNELLKSNLNIIDVLEEGDKVGIFYNFIPCTQYTWRSQYKQTIDKVKNKEPTERNKSGAQFIIKYVFSSLSSIINSVMSSIVSEPINGSQINPLANLMDRMNGIQSISNATTQKGNGSIIDTQLIIISESDNDLRKHNNAKSLAQSFESISEDNRLISKRYSRNFSFTEYKINGVSVNKFSDSESQNFIALPGRELLEQYKFMEKIETNETKIPEDLQTGVMCIGENKFRGNIQKAYLTEDEQYRLLLTLLIGPTRAGKSNLIANLGIDVIDNGECIIIMDFIKKCELSDLISEVFPRDKVLNIDCSNFETMQGLGYNEVGISKNTFKQYENAKRQTTNMLSLVNSINGTTDPLTPKMERYLESASLVAFIIGGSIKDVFSILQNHIIRHSFLSKVPINQHENLNEYMNNLYELDELNNDGEVIGTKTQIGIIDRMNKLKRNSYMEMMLKKGTEDNIDLSKEMQKNKIICIKMPQNIFTTDGEKDIFTTYWITKIWLALQVRADRHHEKDLVKVNLIIDEIYQVPNTEMFMTSKLSQVAKFRMKPIISCHYINQLTYMREELRSANTSYMLISGCDKKNYNELKDELYPFTAEDLKNMKRYHSMNYIKDKEGYSSFITKLPGNVEDRIKLRNI